MPLLRAAYVDECSAALGFQLNIVTRAASSNLENLNPLCFAPSVRHIFQKPSSCTNRKRLTRSSRKRQNADFTSPPNVRARTEEAIINEDNKPNTQSDVTLDQEGNPDLASVTVSPSPTSLTDQPMEEEIAPVEFENSSGGGTDELQPDNEETLQAQPSNENMPNGQNDGAETDDSMEEEASNENTPNEQSDGNGAETYEPMEEEGGVPLELPCFVRGMKTQTNPDMACITFCDNNNMFVVCTDQKIKESTTTVILPWYDKKPLEDKNVIVIQGLETSPFVPDSVIDASCLDPILMSDNALCEALITMAAQMAIPANQRIVLVCENAESFGKAASLYAALYLVFRNEGKLDVKQCIDGITQAFRQQCPSCFDENYSVPQIQKFYKALESIQKADRNTLFGRKTLEKIVKEVHKKMLSSLSKVELMSMEYHDHEDLLKWIQDGPGAIDENVPNTSIYPFSSYLRQTGALIPHAAKKQQPGGLSCPDWISKGWPDGNYLKTGVHGQYSPTTIAVNTENIAACAFLLSKMGKKNFFLDHTSEFQQTTPLYHAAKMGHTVLVSWMLKNGGEISLESYNNDGKTPLFAACNMQHIEVVKILILHGAAATDMPYIRKTNFVSTFDLLSLKAVEELRLWVKKLIDADICDDSTMKSHLQSAHNTILNRYLRISCGGDNEEGREIDLSSLDHGDHNFLRDETDILTDLADYDLRDLAVHDAMVMARKALLKQVHPQEYDLCTYYESEKFSLYSRLLDYFVGEKS
jgi:hypothetical protein